jgi:hypothetical protein
MTTLVVKTTSERQDLGPRSHDIILEVGIGHRWPLALKTEERHEPESAL